MGLDQDVAQEFALDVLEFNVEMTDYTIVGARHSADRDRWVFLAKAPSGNPLDNAWVEVTADYSSTVTQVPEAEWMEWPEVPLLALSAAASTETFYSPGQPRAPKGTSGGGQWIKTGGGIAGMGGPGTAVGDLDSPPGLVEAGAPGGPPSDDHGRDVWAYQHKVDRLVVEELPWIGPRTPEQAVKECNPLDGSINCLMTANSFELRRRGFDAQAMLGQGPAAMRGQGWEKWWEPEQGDYRFLEVIMPDWIGVKTGEQAKFEVVNELLAKHPPGARGAFTTMNLRAGVGHITNWEIDAGTGKVRFFDPQSGEEFTDNDAEWARMASSVAEYQVPRLDDLKASWRITEGIVPSSRLDKVQEALDRYDEAVIANDEGRLSDAAYLQAMDDYDRAVVQATRHDR
jgi:hypothetical protein